MSLSTAQDVKERVRDATDILELIGSQVRLDRRGRHYVGLCPFHDDSRPSLTVNPDRQTYKCWACGAGGDVFAFVMQRESVEFREALETLADRAGIALSGQKSSNVDPSLSKKRQLEVLGWAAEEFHSLLLSAGGKPARAYLEERGITDRSIGKFRLGFAPADWSWLRDRADRAGYTDALLDAVGLLSRSEKSPRPYDRFRGRLMFPIHDVQGRVIAFGGRVLPGLSPPDAAKYINSPETALFNKSEQLYALHLARQTATKQDPIVVVEGYTDAIMAWQTGVAHVVAVLGTALGAAHLKLLQRYVTRVVLVLDGDEAGRRRANEVVGLFLASQQDVRIATLPEELDPCDFIAQRGAAGFQQLVGSAPDALSYKLNLLTEGMDPVRDTHAANAALEELLTLMAHIPTGTRRAHSGQWLRRRQALQLVAQTFHLPVETLELRLRQLRTTARGPASTAASTAPTEVASQLDPWDLELLALISHRPDLLPKIRQAIRPDDLTSSVGKSIYGIWSRIVDEQHNVSFDDVLLHVEDLPTKRMLVQIEGHADKYDSTRVDAASVLRDLIQAFRDRAHRQEVRRQRAAIESADLDEQSKFEALMQIVQRQKDRLSVSATMDG